MWDGGRSSPLTLKILSGKIFKLRNVAVTLKYIMKGRNIILKIIECN